MPRTTSPETTSDEGHSLSASVDPTTDWTTAAEMDVPEDGSIEDLQARIYPGPELDLQLRPELVRADGSAPAVPIVNLHGKNYIDGDDDAWRWDIHQPVSEGDEIRILARNLGTETYSFRVNLDIDHAAGVKRFLGGLL